MDINELNLVWSKVLDKAFIGKKMISYELKKESSIESYDKITRSIYVVVQKEYAKKLIISNAKVLKREFPMLSNLLVDYFYVNETLIDQIEIKELMGNQIDQDKIIDNKIIVDEPISQNITQEEVLDSSFFLLKNEEKLLEKAKTIKISFYSCTLNRTKELFIKTNIYHRKNLLILSVIFFLTIIVPSFLLIEYYRRKISEKIVELQINELLLFGYEPEDEQTKNFLKLHQLDKK